MRKVFMLVGWLTLGLDGLILMAFAPRSWLCPASPVTGVLYNPVEATMLVVRRYGQDVEVWERDGEQPVSRSRFADHVGPVRSVAFAPDGQTYATASEDGTAILWETRSGARLHTLQGHTAPVYSVAFAPDGQTVLTASDDGAASLWDARSGSHLRTLCPLLLGKGWVWLGLAMCLVCLTAAAWFFHRSFRYPLRRQ
jgi:WD40 repeat protein